MTTESMKKVAEAFQREANASRELLLECAKAFEIIASPSWPISATLRDILCREILSQLNKKGITP